MYNKEPQKWTWKELGLLKEALDQGLVEDSDSELVVEEEVSKVGESGEEDTNTEEESEEGETEAEEESWWLEEQETFA